MELLLPIFLLLLSFGFMVLEVFLPSLGILTIASIASFGASLYFGFSYSSSLGLGLIGGAVFGVPILLYLAFRLFPDTPLGRHMILTRTPEDRPEPAVRPRRADLVGREGVARTDLRPAGLAVVDGERLDVITRGELVNAGRSIRIIEISGNRIIVRATEESVPTPDEEEESDLR